MTNPYIEVNNNAVRLLRLGNYEAAVPTFLLALDLFKQHVAASVLKELQSEPPSFIDSVYNPIVDQDSSTARRRRTEMPLSQSQNFYQSCCFRNDELAKRTNPDRLHFYSRAFLLSDRPEDDPSTSNRRDGTSSLLLFNIGVSLHAQAIRTGDTQVLEKALTVYQLALSSADHWVVYSGGKDSLLQMSILNNMALLHIQVMQVCESTSCLQLLKKLIIQWPHIQTDDRDIFDWNVVLFMEGRLDESPAPAA